MDEETAYGVLQEKLDDLITAAEQKRVSVEVSRAIVAALPEAYQQQLGADFDELAAAITQYDMAVDEAARGQ